METKTEGGGKQPPPPVSTRTTFMEPPEKSPLSTIRTWDDLSGWEKFELHVQEILARLERPR